MVDGLESLNKGPLIQKYFEYKIARTNSDRHREEQAEKPNNYFR